MAATESQEPITAEDYEQWALENLDRGTYDFVAGGAGEEVTLRENREGFERLRLVPRVLRDVSAVSGATEVFGASLAAPLFVSPIGMQRLVHDEAELGTARAVRALGIGMMVATASTCTLEDVAAEGGDALWFQLYWRRDRHITQDLVQRAAAAGYKAVVLTVDTPVIGRRLRDARNRYQRPPSIQYANFARYENPEIKDTAGGAPTYYVADQMDRTLTWTDIEWLHDMSGLPVVVKGVLSGDDARLAVAAGAQGVMVSNHGGRQLDHVPGTIDVLEEVVDAVAGNAVVVLDGGVRRATDVLLALAVGADVVAMGRPVLWALAHGGGASVEAFLRAVVEDLVRSMTLAGVPTVNDISRTLVRRLEGLAPLPHRETAVAG
jgi:isopentenyl diphosphate isomerase/L-lactate dehydrogenase-like FMN-dependent dehydrogenase